MTTTNKRRIVARLVVELDEAGVFHLAAGSSSVLLLAFAPNQENMIHVARMLTGGSKKLASGRVSSRSS
jgi:hypothetical protein